MNPADPEEAVGSADGSGARGRLGEVVIMIAERNTTARHFLGSGVVSARRWWASGLYVCILAAVCVLAPMPVEAAAHVTVKARLMYLHDGESVGQPIQGAKVLLMDAETGPDKQVGDHKHTDQNGDVSFSCNNDDGVGQGGRDLYLKVYAENDAAWVEDRWDRTYYWSLSKIVSNATDNKTYSYGTKTLNQNNTLRKAFEAADACWDARAFTYKWNGWRRSKVEILFPAPDPPFKDIPAYFAPAYTPGLSLVPSPNDRITLPSWSDPPGNLGKWERDTVLHEYGHAVMYSAYGPASLPINYSKPLDLLKWMDHGPTKEVNAQFALMEGWAEFFACAVDDTTANYYFSEDENIETNSWWSADGSEFDGHRSEGSVASIMWDICDGPVEAPDGTIVPDDEPMHTDFGRLFSLMKSKKPTTAYQLWDQWVALWPDLNTSVGPLCSVYWANGVNKDVYPPFGKSVGGSTGVSARGSDYQGRTYTNSANVSLDLAADDWGAGALGNVSVRVGNSAATLGQWSPYYSDRSRNHALTQGDGEKTVYAQFSEMRPVDNASAGANLLSPIYSAKIVLDTTPPEGWISINAGAECATSRFVTLVLGYTDAYSGCDMVQISNDGVFDTEPWQSPSPLKDWLLDAGDGVKTVHYRLRDRLGNVSSAYSDTILSPPKWTSEVSDSEPWPDPEVVSVSCSELTLWTDKEFRVSARLRNKGDRPATDAYLSLFLAPASLNVNAENIAALVASNKVHILEEPLAFTIEGEKTRVITRSLSIGEAMVIPSGGYKIVAWVVYPPDINPGDTVQLSTQIQVRPKPGAPLVYGPLPGLMPNLVAVNLEAPSTWRPGYSNPQKVKVRIMNTGVGPTLSACDAVIYAGGYDNIEFGGVTLRRSGGREIARFRVPPMQELTLRDFELEVFLPGTVDLFEKQQPAFGFGPTFLSSFDHVSLELHVDAENEVWEPVESDNSLDKPITVLPTSELEVADVQAAQIARPGQSVTVTDTIANLGGGPTERMAHVAYWLSKDTVWSSTEDTYLGAREIPVLAKGGESTAAKTIRIPGTWPDGDCYLLVWADANNWTAEWDDSNNTEPRPIRIDSTAPKKPTSFDVRQGEEAAVLTWDAPTDADVVEVRVMGSTTGYPTSAEPAADQFVVAQTQGDSHIDAGHPEGSGVQSAVASTVGLQTAANLAGEPLTVYYTAFAIDDAANVSAAGYASAVLQPTGPPLDIPADGDEWLKLSPWRPAEGDRFAGSGALDIDGDTVVIGADADDVGGADSGSVYVYVRSDTGWALQSRLTAPDRREGQRFGRAVAIDGDTLVVGAASYPATTNTKGEAYVFTRSSGNWSQGAKLVPGNALDDGDTFGGCVDVSGSTIVVGAWSDDDTVSGAGAVYVFTRSGQTWAQSAKLRALAPQSWSSFGGDVALDGGTLLVGARNYDGSDVDVGAVYVFTGSGTSWTQRKLLTAPDAAANDGFCIVSLSGTTALIGSFLDDEKGSAYVFTGSGADWSLQQKLTVPDGASLDRFGQGVAVSGDIALVGAASDDVGDQVDAGSFYVFKRTGTTWGEPEKHVLTRGPTENDWFGGVGAVDGGIAVAGAPARDDQGVDSGAAYLYDLLKPSTSCDATATYASSATINLTATDAESGVRTVHYSLDHGPWIEGAVVKTSAPGPHELRYYAEDNAGNLEPELRAAFTVVAPIYLSTKAYPTLLSRYGASTKISGYLRHGSTGGTSVASERVYVQASSNGTSGWKNVAALTSSSTGYVAWLTVPRSATYYRFSYMGRADWYSDAVSTAVKVVPRSYVRTPIAPKTMRRSRYYSVYGWLKPRHTAGTYPVRIYKWKRTSSGKWKSYGYVNAKAYNYLSYTKYLRKIKLTSRGKWRLRAYARADSGHAAAWSSGYDYVTVK
jgi:hypothetical protein